MTTRQPRYSAEETARRGDEIYERDIRRALVQKRRRGFNGTVRVLPPSSSASKKEQLVMQLDIAPGFGHHRAHARQVVAEFRVEQIFHGQHRAVPGM